MPLKTTQKTIKNPVEIEGVGLFTGKQVKLRLLPSAQDTGITFTRVDLPQKPRIPVRSENAQPKLRRTVLAKDNVEVETVEHLLSAINGLGIDNVEIELNSQEVPVCDGSSKVFVDALKDNQVEQDAPKKIISITEPIFITEENKITLVALPTTGELSISYTLDYESDILETEHLFINLNETNYIEQISPARTFCLKSEADYFLSQGLGKGGNYQNTLVVGPNGIIETKLRFKDEFVRHKVLDFIGDITFLNAYLKACIIAVKSGHSTNIKLVKKILQLSQEKESTPKKKESLLDIREIYKVLPHRYPMLLIDKVIELDGYKRAVGVKNVSINEPFFQGHFPDQPVMPGVLQLESMAQLAGVLLIRQSRAENVSRTPVLLSLDNTKFRKSVIPGDQLVIEVEATKIRTRTAEVYAKASINGELAVESIMKFMLIEH